MKWVGEKLRLLDEVIKKYMPCCEVVLGNNTITADGKKRRSFAAMLSCRRPWQTLNDEMARDEMARKELERAKAIEEDYVSLVKQDLGASIQYLLDMERMFDHDTRRLFELVRVHIDSVVADRQNSDKFEEFQLFARAFVRALFAHVEGVTYLMRQVVLWANDRGDIALTQSELSSLSEGERFNTVKENFRLAFDYFPRLFGSSYRPDKNNQGWCFFCRSIKVRDDITHPKTTMEFKLSGDAVREAQIAAMWFNETLRSLLISCADDA